MWELYVGIRVEHAHHSVPRWLTRGGGDADYEATDDSDDGGHAKAGGNAVGTAGSKAGGIAGGKAVGRDDAAAGAAGLDASLLNPGQFEPVGLQKHGAWCPNGPQEFQGRVLKVRAA